jgi:hypothetical protein
MKYADVVIKDDEVPVASSPIFQHIVKTYASESVPSTYGPTADVRWEGADPSQSIAAASRK